MFFKHSLKDIDLHNLTSIPGGLFYNCKNFQSFEIAESVDLIELAQLNWSYSWSSTTSVTAPTFGEVPLRKLIVRGNSSSNVIRAGLYHDGFLFTEINERWNGITQEILDRSWCESLVYLELGCPINGTLIDCPDLKTLVVDYQLQSMDGIIKQQMSQLDKLEILQISSLIPPAISETTFSKAQYMNLRVVVQDDVVDDYRKVAVWKNFWNLTSKSDYEAGIENIYSDGKTELARYDLMGNPVTTNYHGIVIIMYSDGTANKRFISE